MIMIDNALKARQEQGKPIRVGMVGAGFMGQGLTNQIENSVPGMRMAAIYNRPKLDESVRRGLPAVAEDPFTICRCPDIDIVVDVTGSVEFGARVILEAFRNGKPVLLMNAEVDATIGPILRVYGKKYGQILSACDGDEPGVEMNLVRWVKGLGLTPRVIGNVKGLQDPYRNPTTQKGWAERWAQNPAMVTSFADGSKISFEQSIVANATGFKVQSRGMSRGRKYDGSILEIQKLYDLDQVRSLGGIVDYTVGPPLIKVFVLAEHHDPKQRHYLNLYKMGEGPLYPFWRRAGAAAGRPGGGGLRVGQAGSRRGRGARRIRHVHDLRRGRERRGDERGPLPARGPGRGMQAAAPHCQGPGAHVRRRRAARRADRRSPAGGAVPALPRRDLAGGAPPEVRAGAPPAGRATDLKLKQGT